ncbi:gp443 [Bacillus phage G]|uniref:Gp443 n=1 Tax=Bacillus phage G TaxID=2884420 RepID=G3MAI4_9CAUD|nr:gp443 [Bacillus phage G]AEO93701.1 gp443 [Bacillus phage G]
MYDTIVLSIFFVIVVPMIFLLLLSRGKVEMKCLKCKKTFTQFRVRSHSYYYEQRCPHCNYRYSTMRRKKVTLKR